MRTLNPNTLERVENYSTEYQKKHGKSPSYRQIMHGVGMSSLNLVQRYVLALEREGRIERTRIGHITGPPARNVCISFSIIVSRLPAARVRGLGPRAPSSTRR